MADDTDYSGISILILGACAVFADCSSEARILVSSLTSLTSHALTHPETDKKFRNPNTAASINYAVINALSISSRLYETKLIHGYHVFR